MTKEIHDINTKAVDFVVELIDYIFEYPDDDYMTMECLCRKLHKHGLLDKADGYYQTHDKTESSNSEKPNNFKWSVEYAKEMLDTMSCEECGHWEHGAGDHYYCALLEMRQECCFESKGESTLMFANKPKDEPKICDTCRYYNSNIPCGSTPSACKEADKFAEEFVDGLKKLKPQTEPTISKMEQVDEPKTQMKTQNSNLTFEKADVRTANGL